METQQLPDFSLRQKMAMVTRTGLFLAVLLAVQMLGLPNLVTGAIVNAIFIAALLLTDLKYALLLAFLSPIGGVFSGHLPAPMYPVLPVIICGNFIFIGTYQLLATGGKFIRFVVPAALKGLIVGVVGYLIIQKFGVPDQVKWFLFPVLGIQFLTAFIGLIAGENFFQALTIARGKAD